MQKACYFRQKNFSLKRVGNLLAIVLLVCVLVLLIYVKEAGAEKSAGARPRLILPPPVPIDSWKYGAEYVSQGPSPIVVEEGGKAHLWVDFRNCWGAVWPVGEHVRLGTSNPLDRKSSFYDTSWLGYNRPTALTINFTRRLPWLPVFCDEVGRFAFDVKANVPPGTYYEYFRPVADGYHWMEDYGVFFRIDVVGYGATWSGQSPPIFVSHGLVSGDAWFDFFNTGGISWPIGGRVRLATSKPRDRNSKFSFQFSQGDSVFDWLSKNRVTCVTDNLKVPGKNWIDPGEAGRFRFNVDAGGVPPGIYREHFELVVDGVTWINGTSCYIDIVVL